MKHLHRHSPPWTTWMWAALVWTAAAVAVGRSKSDPAGPMVASIGLFPTDGWDAAPTAAQESTLPWKSAAGKADEKNMSPTLSPELTAALSATDGEWRHLSHDLRAAIDAAQLTPAQWSGVLVGMTGTSEDSSRDAKVSATPVTWHFVIGNGSRSADGEIELHRIPLAESAGSDSVRVALVGDPRAQSPTVAQGCALRELADYLRAKLGVVPCRIVPNATAGLAGGRGLPAAEIEAALNGR